MSDPIIGIAYMLKLIKANKIKGSTNQADTHTHIIVTKFSRKNNIIRAIFFQKEQILHEVIYKGY